MKLFLVFMAVLVFIFGCTQTQVQNQAENTMPIQENNFEVKEPEPPVDQTQNIPNSAESQTQEEVGGSTQPVYKPQYNYGYGNSNQRDLGVYSRQTFELVSEVERAQLPDCDETFFSYAPSPVEDIMAIEPIGSVTPPEHALASSSTDTYVAVAMQNASEELFDLVAPADIWITFIQPRFGVTQDPQDHVIHFALCKEVFGIFDHVKQFSPKMLEIIEKTNCPHGGTPGSYQCPVMVLEKVNAGEVLGKVGRLQGNYNFGTWDLRVLHKYPTPQKYGVRSIHSTCPLDYYKEPLKNQLYALLDGDFGDCGTVDSYVKDSLRGEWFFENATNKMAFDWFKQLYFGPSNKFSSKQVISVGGVISEPLKWVIEPQNSGKVNRNFSYILAGGEIFCFENTQLNQEIGEKGETGRILAQVISDNELKAEFQKGTCVEPFAFKEPKTFNR